jgi:hypothetical protein
MEDIKKSIKDGVLFGIGYVIGKHNLNKPTNKELHKISDDFADDVVKNKLFNNEYKTKLLIDFKRYWKRSTHQNIDDAIKGYLNKYIKNHEKNY